MKFCDLHIHTNFSDSTNSISDVIELVRREEISCISITDHDTVEAVDRITKEAERFNIEVIAGIELTTELEGSEIHILGYLFDYKDETLLKKLDEIKQIRTQRMYEMIEKLEEKGINIDFKSITEPSKSGIVTRLHLAKKMLELGYVRSISEAFAKYIGDNAPCYVSRFRLSPKEAINLILKTKGIPILAHPKNPNKDFLIPKFIEYGLKGIEAFYPEYTLLETNYYEGLAKKYGLLITGGSDCHGTLKERPLIGKIKIPYRYVEKLKKEKETLL